MAEAKGYSGKLLYQKLGLKPGIICLTMGAPAHYKDLVEGTEGVAFRMRARSADVVHLFCKDLNALESRFEKALSHVREGGMLWVSWPKKSSVLYKDLTEDDLRRILLPTGWVDVKVCAIDADWSGLKFLKRKK